MKLTSQEYAELLQRHPNLAPCLSKEIENYEAAKLRHSKRLQEASGGPSMGSSGSGWYKVPPQGNGAIIGQKNASHSVPKPLLNKTETRYRELLLMNHVDPLLQAITLRLDPPFKSYRADLAYVDSRGGLVLVEVKARHRFMEKGIAKAALAAKCYPQFRFVLALWENKQFKETILPS